MAEEQITPEPEVETPAKPKKKLIQWILLFGISFVLVGVGNYFYLKANYVPPPPPPPPEEKKPVLTIDLDGSGEESEPSQMPSDSTEEVTTVEPGIAVVDSTPLLDSLLAATMAPTEVASAEATVDSAEQIEPEEELAQAQPVVEEEAGVDSAAQKRSAKLAKIVENMPAEDAAQMLEALSDEMIIDILLRLKQRQAAKIMAEIPASRAANISRIILEPMAQQK
ncbi:MAG TPA: hypothetical protein VF398_05740 [bacterium]